VGVVVWCVNDAFNPVPSCCPARVARGGLLIAAWASKSNTACAHILGNCLTSRVAQTEDFLLKFCSNCALNLADKALLCRLSCLVSSCFFRVHPLGGLFLAHAEAGLHCTVQSITPPWAGCSGLMHLNHLGALCPCPANAANLPTQGELYDGPRATSELGAEGSLNALERPEAQGAYVLAPRTIPKF